MSGEISWPRKIKVAGRRVEKKRRLLHNISDATWSQQWANDFRKAYHKAEFDAVSGPHSY